MKILIVDDDKNSTVTMKALLISQADYEIDIATSGMKALDMIKEKEYELIFLDIMMPDFSGLDFAKKMSESDLLKNIPVIISSALPISSDELKTMLDDFKKNCNVKGILEKPFSLDKMLEEVKKALN
ncbi:MAG: response regulator [Patescibacteria group bacterium]|jgi:CheY-like chemotaxis protein|nr:response regulator [Patescibacteria group bacterium]